MVNLALWVTALCCSQPHFLQNSSQGMGIIKLLTSQDQWVLKYAREVPLKGNKPSASYISRKTQCSFPQKGMCPWLHLLMPSRSGPGASNPQWDVRWLLLQAGGGGGTSRGPALCWHCDPMKETASCMILVQILINLEWTVWSLDILQGYEESCPDCSTWPEVIYLCRG